LKKVVAESECIKLDEPLPHRNGKDETVNGVTFKVAETDGVAAGNFPEGHVYRTFHDGKCYELEIRIASSNIANHESGSVKSFDLGKVQRTLKFAVASFTFLSRSLGFANECYRDFATIIDLPVHLNCWRNMEWLYLTRFTKGWRTEATTIWNDGTNLSTTPREGQFCGPDFDTLEADLFRRLDWQTLVPSVRSRTCNFECGH
jgi:hypothetical protein